MYTYFLSVFTVGPCSHLVLCVVTEQQHKIMWSFVKKHRNKFALAGAISAAGAGGLYLLNKYVETKIAEQKDKETQQMLEQIKHQHHFQSTKRIAENTLNSAINPALRQVTVL